MIYNEIRFTFLYEFIPNEDRLDNEVGILCLYIRDMLMYDERATKIIYHLFAGAMYILPLFEGIVADTWLGKYKTIFYLSLVSAAGNAVLTVSAIKPTQLLGTALLIVALIIIAVGTGGIKCSVIAFANDQFVLPKQKDKMKAYFHVFYFIINVGGFISLLITPLLRSRVSCMGKDTCYSLAFLLPVVLMLSANAIFKAGKPLYRMVPPEQSMLVEVVSCAYTAMKNKSRIVLKDHWLDYAVENHGEEMVTNTKTFFGIFLVFLPVPVFWALFEQQATAWNFQATHMSGELGNGFKISPDQMQIANHTLLFIFIPLFEYVIYPFFGVLKLLKAPLQRMAIGGILAGISFVLAASLQRDIENLQNHSLEQLPANKAVMRIVHVFNCEASFRGGYFHKKDWYRASAMSMYTFEAVEFNRKRIDFSGPDCYDIYYVLTKHDLPEMGKYLTCFTFKKEEPAWCRIEDLTDFPEGKCRVRIILNLNKDNSQIDKVMVTFIDNNGLLYKQFFDTDQSNYYITPGMYSIELSTSYGTPRYSVTFSWGGVYLVGIFTEPNGTFTIRNFEIFPPYPLHMVDLLPQYVVMTAAEVMFTISGLEFAYENTPEKLKSVVLPLWFFGAGIGQILVVLIEAIRIHEKDSSMYLLYANFMFLNMIIFLLITIFCYKDETLEDIDEDEDEDALL